MFLLKILMPGFFVRDRPDRASPRKTKKADDFPAREPGEPSATNVTRKIRFHLLHPWQVIQKQGHWAVQHRRVHRGIEQSDEYGRLLAALSGDRWMLNGRAIW